MSYYIYKLKDKSDKILYVGQTICMFRRMYEHKRDKEWFSEVSNIEYTECTDCFAMDIYEKYYIITIRPKYNIKDMKYEDTNIILPELTGWLEYDIKKIDELYKQWLNTNFEQQKIEFEKTVWNILKDKIENKISINGYCIENSIYNNGYLIRHIKNKLNNNNDNDFKLTKTYAKIIIDRYIQELLITNLLVRCRLTKTLKDKFKINIKGNPNILYKENNDI